VLSRLRRDLDGRQLLIVINATPIPRSNYRIGVPVPGFWREELNSDAVEYGGSGWGNLGGVDAAPVPDHGFYDSVSLNLPPLAVVFMAADNNCYQAILN
jgi:1,4-alpha-glucan branching enzyme